MATSTSTPPTAAEGRLQRRLLPSLFGFGLVTAVAWPLSWTPPRDSFPLSPYPMFARDVSEAKEALLVRAVAIDRAGRRRVLPPEWVANQEVMQAFATLRQAADGGPITSQALCQTIAARLASKAASGTPFAHCQSVEIGTYRYHPVDYFTAAASPQRLALHATCSVRHPAAAPLRL